MTGCYYTYILRCEGGFLYTGVTTDPARRFAEHLGCGGRGARFTALRKPLRFEALWRCPDRSAALRLEARIKALSRPQKDALLRGESPQEAVFSSCERMPPPVM